MKLLKLLLLPLLYLSLTNCTPNIPDVPVCEPLDQWTSVDAKTGHTLLNPSPTCETEVGEASCGHCIFIVSQKEAFVGEGAKHLLLGKKWSELKTESAYLPAKESYAPLATYIINACKKMNCNAQVTKFKVQLDHLGSLKAAIP